MHSQSGSLILPGVWKLDESGDPEVPVCRHCSFPRQRKGVNTPPPTSLFYHTLKGAWDSGADLPFCLEGVGIQAVNIVENHVVTERYIGTGIKRNSKNNVTS